MEPHAAPSATPSARPLSPTFLTVEEAAAVLRIGRTAAYLLARRWEDTAGAEGLPVLRFGRLLRVPVRELERLAAGAIDLAAEAPPASVHEEPRARASEPERTRRPTSARPRRKPDPTQTSLFPDPA
jgi:hypothetical protein